LRNGFVAEEEEGKGCTILFYSFQTPSRKEGERKTLLLPLSWERKGGGGTWRDVGWGKKKKINAELLLPYLSKEGEKDRVTRKTWSPRGLTRGFLFPRCRVEREGEKKKGMEKSTMFQERRKRGGRRINHIL